MPVTVAAGPLVQQASRHCQYQMRKPVGRDAVAAGRAFRQNRSILAKYNQF